MTSGEAPETRAQAGRNGLLVAIRGAMREHAASEGVQKQACAAIAGIVAGVQENQASAAQLELLADIQRGMRVRQTGPQPPLPQHTHTHT